MSKDKSVTKDLMETLADGRDGFAQGATKLDDESPEIATTFRRLSSQRATFYAELEEMAKNHGDDVEESGSTLASLHRGWMALKDTLSGSQQARFNTLNFVIVLVTNGARTARDVEAGGEFSRRVGSDPDVERGLVGYPVFGRRSNSAAR